MKTEYVVCANELLYYDEKIRTFNHFSKESNNTNIPLAWGVGLRISTDHSPDLGTKSVALVFRRKKRMVLLMEWEQ